MRRTACALNPGCFLKVTKDYCRGNRTFLWYREFDLSWSFLLHISLWDSVWHLAVRLVGKWGLACACSQPLCLFSLAGLDSCQYCRRCLSSLHFFTTWISLPLHKKLEKNGLYKLLLSTLKLDFLILHALLVERPDTLVCLIFVWKVYLLGRNFADCFNAGSVELDRIICIMFFLTFMSDLGKNNTVFSKFKSV